MDAPGTRGPGGRYDGDMEALCLDFTVEVEAFGRVEARELLPGGGRMAVTQANKLAYVHAMADYKRAP